MICPKCGIEAVIMKSEVVVSGDTSPEEETRVESVLKFHCRNPNCVKYGQEVGESRHQIYPAEKGGEDDGKEKRV